MANKKIDWIKISNDLEHYELTSEQNTQIIKLMKCKNTYSDVDSFINALIRCMYFSMERKIDEIDLETLEWDLTQLGEFFNV